MHVPVAFEMQCDVLCFKTFRMSVLGKSAGKAGDGFDEFVGHLKQQLCAGSVSSNAVCFEIKTDANLFHILIEGSAGIDGFQHLLQLLWCVYKHVRTSTWKSKRNEHARAFYQPHLCLLCGLQ